MQDAVIRQFSIIGEAAAKLSPVTKAAHPEIPWKAIVGMRNVIIHEYSETDLPTIWAAVERDLSVLKKAVTAMNKRKAA